MAIAAGQRASVAMSFLFVAGCGEKLKPVTEDDFKKTSDALVHNYMGKGHTPAEKIAEVVFEALTTAQPKVRYQITPDPMRHLITTILPKRTVDRIIAKRLGLTPSA